MTRIAPSRSRPWLVMYASIPSSRRRSARANRSATVMASSRLSLSRRSAAIILLVPIIQKCPSASSPPRYRRNAPPQPRVRRVELPALVPGHDERQRLELQGNVEEAEAVGAAGLQGQTLRQDPEEIRVRDQRRGGKGMRGRHRHGPRKGAALPDDRDETPSFLARVEDTGLRDWPKPTAV